MPKKIKCTYMSLCNSLSLHCDDEDLFLDPRSDAVEEAVCGPASHRCTVDGEFRGDIGRVERACHRHVKKHFGPEYEVEFAEDSKSY